MDIDGQVYKKISKLVAKTSEQIQDICDEPQSSSTSHNVSSQATSGAGASPCKDLINKIYDLQIQAYDKSLTLMQEQKQLMILRNQAKLALQEQILVLMKQLEQEPQPVLEGDKNL